VWTSCSVVTRVAVGLVGSVPPFPAPVTKFIVVVAFLLECFRQVGCVGGKSGWVVMEAHVSPTEQHQQNSEPGPHNHIMLGRGRTTRRGVLGGGWYSTTKPDAACPALRGRP
jgi:hypothetical protein